MPGNLSSSVDLRATVDRLSAQLLDSAGGSGTASVWLSDLDGEPALTRDADAVHYAASTMKLPLVVAAYRLHERGELDLDEEVPVHNTFASAADGSPYSLQQVDDQDDETWDRLGSTCSLRVLAEHALVKSGNLATNLVLERTGAAEVAAVLGAAGCSPATRVVRGIEDLVAAQAGVNNLVTAADLGLVMRGLANRTVGPVAVCEAVEEILSRQEHRSGVPAGLPAGTYVANKTGWVDGITHDVALVRPTGEAPYVLVVLTTVDVPEDDAQTYIADVSHAVAEGRHR